MNTPETQSRHSVQRMVRRFTVEVIRKKYRNAKQEIVKHEGEINGRLHHSNLAATFANIARLIIPEHSKAEDPDKVTLTIYPPNTKVSEVAGRKE